MFFIENERFRLGAVQTGAELRSFVDKRGGGYEYLWQGGPIWNGCSPLLFPVVGKLKDDTYTFNLPTTGKLKDDTYTFNGKAYKMEKHGFARKMTFSVEEQTSDRITFLLTDTAATRICYPFSFALRVSYSFTENGFVITHQVNNTGADTLYFSLGAHPGFQCEMGDRIILDEPETAAAFKLDDMQLRGTIMQSIFENSCELVITPELFAEDALIFDGLRSGGCTLTRPNGRNVHIEFGGAPCLGIWAKPAAPYVCIEPWYGIDDAWDSSGDLADKYRICCLNAQDEFVFSVTITV